MMPHREFLTGTWRIVLIFSFVALFALVFYGASAARRNASNSVIDWLPKKFEETTTFFKYLELFHEGELLMVGWEGCELEYPAQEEMSRSLTTPSTDAPAYYERSLTTKQILDEFTAEPLELSREKAIERMKGWIAGQDGKRAASFCSFRRRAARTAMRPSRRCIMRRKRS